MAKLGKSQREKDPTQVVSVAAFKDGKLLLGLRNDDASWNLPGGHVEPGEDPYAAAKRELKEETGMRMAMQNMRRVGFCDVRDDLRVHFFICDVVHGDPDASQDPDEEMAAFKWVDHKNIPKSILSNLHNKEDVALQFLGAQDRTLDIVWDEDDAGDHEGRRYLEKLGVEMSKAAPKFWRTKDGVKIPSVGTPEHDDYNKKFFEALNQHFGEGRGNKLVPVQVPVDKLYGHNMPVNKERLKLYTRMLRAGHPVPPVVVKRSGNAFTLVDGNHRHAAAQATNQQMLNAYEIVSPKMRKDELPENIDIAKGLMGAVAGIALAASPIHKPDGHDTELRHKAMQSIKETVKPWTPEGLHEDLHGIAHLESSFGKNIKHAHHTKGEYHTAVGAVGLKPITAHEEYKRTKTLQQLYPNLNDPAEFTKKLQNDHVFYNHVASAHWARLKAALKSPLKTAYAWRWGIGAARRADDAKVLGDPYVQKYHALTNQVVMKSEDAVVLLKNEAEDEIARMLAHPDPHEAKLALKMNGVGLKHLKQAATHHDPTVIEAALAHPEANDEVFRHAVDTALSRQLSKYVTSRIIHAFEPKMHTVHGEYWDDAIKEGSGEKFNRLFSSSAVLKRANMSEGQINQLLDRGNESLSTALTANPNFKATHVSRLFNDLHGYNRRIRSPDFDSGEDEDWHNPKARDFGVQSKKYVAERALMHALHNNAPMPPDINQHLLSSDNHNLIGIGIDKNLPGLHDAAVQWAMDPSRETRDNHDFAGNAVLIHAMRANPAIVQPHLGKIMSNPKLSQAQLELIQGRGRYNLTPDLLQKFINAHEAAGTDSLHIVGQHPNLTPEQVNHLATHHDPQVRKSVLTDEHISKLTPNTMQKLMTDGRPDVRSLAFHKMPMTPEQITAAINDPTVDYHQSLRALALRPDLNHSHIHDLMVHPQFKANHDFYRHPSFNHEHIASAYNKSLQRMEEGPMVEALQHRPDLVRPEHIDAALTLAKKLGVAHGGRLEQQVASSHALMPKHVDYMLKNINDMYYKDSAFRNLLENPAFSKDHLIHTIKNLQPWQINMLGNSKHINHPDVLPHLLNGTPTLRAYAYNNPNLTADQIRYAFNREAKEAPQHLPALVSHLNTPDDVVEQAMKVPYVAEKAKEVYARHRPDSVYTESVNVKPGLGMLRHIRDMMQSANMKEVTPDVLNAATHGWDGKTGRMPNGKVSLQRLAQAIEDAPSTKFHISHGQYGKHPHDVDLDEDMDLPSASEWDIAYDQRHTPEPSKVLFLNVTNDHIAKMKNAGVYQTFMKLQDMNKHAGLDSPPHAVAWVRYTGTPKDGIHIDEMQSDHHVSHVKKLEAAYRRAGNHGPEHKERIKQNIEKAEKDIPQAHQKIINKILFGSKSGMEVAHEALRQHLRDQGHHDTVIHIPASSIKRQMSLTDKDAATPPHMLETYDEVPEKKYGMKPAKYGELKTQSNHDLHGQPTRAGKVLKTED